MAHTIQHRLVVAGLAGDTGKSLVSLGIIGALRARGLVVAPFKKGPDFIDAAWLGAAAGCPGRNLDTFLMSDARILASAAEHGRAADVTLVEGNRGLFDGVDAQGTHSTAILARLLRAPVILVIDARKVTRTIAALVAGVQALDPELTISGVVLNRVGTMRQEELIRAAVEAETGVPVLGAIPRLPDQHLPSRHLGLVTAFEHPDTKAVLRKIAHIVDQYVDVNAILERVRRHDIPVIEEEPRSGLRPAPRTRIGVLRDRAFSFYYPENLTALEMAGAELVTISPIDDEELPEVDALYAGGGFPEEHGEELSGNTSLREALRRRIEDGMPVWAECGGLMYLSRAVVVDGIVHPMVGVLPVTVEHTSRPQAHGYVEARVERDNPFLPAGTAFRGHEFHYSRLRDNVTTLDTVIRLERGEGLGAGRDGLRARNVVATYIHLHALGVPEWATALVDTAAGVSS
ncbi:MAG: cobyrinate a,c-diamide synthase [Planctomycetota bacterium]